MPKIEPWVLVLLILCALAAVGAVAMTAMEGTAWIEPYL